MSTTKRRIDPGVVQQLLAEPQRVEFFQALRILERFLARGTGHLSSAFLRGVRFRNSLSLAFPPTEIESMQAVDAEGHALDTQDTTAEPSFGQVWITPAFTGFLGVHGTLPRHYTERVAEQESRRDRAARAFLDIFLQRAVTLHYEAWKKYRPHVLADLPGGGRFLPDLLALAGFGHGAQRRGLANGDRDVFDQSIAYHAAAIRQRPLSAAFAQRLLSAHFRIAMRVEQFVGAWCRVPEDQRSTLRANATHLGSAVLGRRAWQRDLRVRIWIGPLDRARFSRFLPGQPSATALTTWLTLLIGPCIEYEVRLILKAAEVRGAKLGEHDTSRLSWGAYLCSRASRVDRSDTRFNASHVYQGGAHG